MKRAELSNHFLTRAGLAGLLGLGLAAGLYAAPSPRRPPLPKVRVAEDGHSFVTADGKPFVPFGVTYYRPGTGWAPRVWRRFDGEATRRDFARMKALGVNCVRVFLTYGSFFPTPDAPAPEGLAKFDRFLALAEEAGLYVHPTGPDHWEGTPAWAKGDNIADERHLAALETFWKTFARRYRGRPVLFAYDLRNEPAVAWDGPVMRTRWNAWLRSRYGSAAKLARAWGVAPAAVHWGAEPPPPPRDAPGNRRLLDYQQFRESVADEWTRRQAAAIRAADPQALVTVGLVQWSMPAALGSVGHYSGFRPRRQARHLDFLEVHFYPLAAGFYEYGGAGAERRNLAFLEAVVREAAAAGKPVVVAEFGWYGGGRLTIDGGRHPAAGEDRQARWCRRVVETTRPLAAGWLNWGLYDHPEAGDVSQLTGLLTADGRVKRWGRDFRTLAQTLAGRHVSRPLPVRSAGLDWDRCVTSTAVGRKFLEDYFRAFEAGASAGP